MSRYDKVDNAYKFLKRKEEAQDSFSLDELAAATGWEVSCLLVAIQCLFLVI